MFFFDFQIRTLDFEIVQGGKLNLRHNFHFKRKLQRLVIDNLKVFQRFGRFRFADWLEFEFLDRAGVSIGDDLVLRLIPHRGSETSFQKLIGYMSLAEARQGGLRGECLHGLDDFLFDHLWWNRDCQSLAGGADIFNLEVVT